MRLYRAMSKEELDKTKENILSFKKTKNKWFTPSFGFLFRRLRKRNQYQYAIAIETNFKDFRILNPKEYMINHNFQFKILWIKKLSELL